MIFKEKINPNKIAKITGLLYGPLMILLGPLAIVYIPAVLVVVGDTSKTTYNIITNHYKPPSLLSSIIYQKRLT